MGPCRRQAAAPADPTRCPAARTAPSNKQLAVRRSSILPTHVAPVYFSLGVGGPHGRRLGSAAQPGARPQPVAVPGACVRGGTAAVHLRLPRVGGGSHARHSTGPGPAGGPLWRVHRRCADCARCRLCLLRPLLAALAAPCLLPAAPLHCTSLCYACCWWRGAHHEPGALSWEFGDTGLGGQ
jgi:hypothetical protein